MNKSYSYNLANLRETGPPKKLPPGEEKGLVDIPPDPVT